MNYFETQMLQKQLIRDEGLELSPYRDSLGFLTIGVGRLIDNYGGGGITREEALYLLKNDILKHTNAVVARLPWADTAILGEERFAALINMHFQLGNKLFQFTKTLKLLEEQKFEEAAHEMLKSQWARQTPQRAQRIAQQIRTGKWV